MRCIIAGGRDHTDPAIVDEAMSACPFTSEITEVVSGCAIGVDTFGAAWARKRGIHVREFPADWEKLGRRAGPRRNGEMARYADALVAIPGKGTGTHNMLKQAEEHGLRIFVFTNAGDSAFASPPS